MAAASLACLYALTGCDSMYVREEPKVAEQPAKKGAKRPATRPWEGPEKAFTVARVHGGDLIELSDGRMVRYLGVVAPTPQERFFAESREANRQLVGGKSVLLRYFTLQKTAGGELLAYVLLPVSARGKQGFVIANKNMIRSGSARASTATRHPFRGSFLRDEMLAREQKIGIWQD